MAHKGMDKMFDGDSFDDLHTKDEAESSVMYLSHNEGNFRREFEECPHSTHDDEENAVRQVWINLLKSCKRVGFQNFVTDAKARQYGFKF